MGRLQRYLRSLTPSEWESLYTEAQKELRGHKMRSLLERLRRTSAPQVLNPTEKELAKRIERWIWKHAFIQAHKSHPIYASPPIEWISKGALLYHAKGLSTDALALLRAEVHLPLEKLTLLFLRLKIQIESGAAKKASKTLREIEHISDHLRRSIQRERLQLTLWRLLNEYGGSYTEIGQRFLRRLEKHPYWKHTHGTASEESVADTNLRILYALAKGNPMEAYKLCLDKTAQSHPSILLNRWLCSIMLKHPLSEYLSYDTLYTTKLSEYDKATLLNRVLLTLLIYGSPAYLTSKLSLLEHWYLSSGFLPENGLVWLQLLWLCGKSEEAIKLSENLLEKVEGKPFTYIQVALMLLLIYAENHKWNKLVQHLRRLLYWLKRVEKFIASAPVMHKLLRQLYQARLRPQVLSAVAERWKKHLASYPTERYFWEITLLPDWIEARLSHQGIIGYRQNAHRASVTDLEALIQKATRVFPPL